MKSLTTSGEVYWVLSLRIHPGQETSFKALSATMIESTRGETGCLNYEWSLSEDGAVCHVYERYVDCDAVKLHRQRAGELVKQLATLTTVLGFTLYGSPDAEVLQLLAGRNPAVLKPLGGFGR